MRAYLRQKARSALIRHGRLETKPCARLPFSPSLFLSFFSSWSHIAGFGIMTLHEEPSEIATSTAAPVRPPVQHRTNTLGPTSPIQDWEVERATVSQTGKDKSLH